MKKILSSIALLLLASFLLYGFMSTKESHLKNTYANSISGEQLYQKNCTTCHGLDRSGVSPAFPSLKDIDKRMAKNEIVKLLATGRNAMPSFKHLSEEERVALAGFLLGEQTVSNTISLYTPIEAGKNLFVANCASCHKVKPEDAEPAGVRNYGMRPAILGGINKKHSIERFEHILNTGPCYMPSFTNLSATDKANIYKYLSTFEYEGMQSRYRNCRCGMAY
ncbi:MAG: cytochrome c [Bacteroidales bacterium]|nr:cytochrome c [Bacteroidales bacterium]